VANPIEQVLRPVDAWQQRTRAPGFVFGVVKKFGDDRGGMLGGLIAFYAFLSLFPLILLATTVLGFVLHHDPSLQQRIERSALGEFPLIGQDLRTHSLHGSPVAVAVGLVGLLWGSLGAAQMIQFASEEAWGVPNRERPPFVSRVVRALAFYGLLGLAVVGTSVLTVLGSIVGQSDLLGAVGIAAALLLNILVFMTVFKLVSPDSIGWRDVAPGAVLGGIGWQVLQVVGQALVRHNLKHTTELYGQFAVVLGLISFLSLAAQLYVYSLEVNVVRHDRLWPRSILQPPLTRADRRYLSRLAEEEARRPEENVEVRWEEADAPVRRG
jgi:YihY family inner membrane protein